MRRRDHKLFIKFSSCARHRDRYRYRSSQRLSNSFDELRQEPKSHGKSNRETNHTINFTVRRPIKEEVRVRETPPKHPNLGTIWLPYATCLRCINSIYGRIKKETLLLFCIILFCFKFTNTSLFIC